MRKPAAIRPGVAGRVAGGPGRPRSWRRVFDDQLLPILLVAPALVVIAGLVGYPVLRTLWLSLQDASGLRALTQGEMSFIGLGNYLHIFSDPALRRSTIATVLFGLACVAGTMVLGIAVALLLNRPFRGRAVLGVLVLLPWAIPQVAASLVWRWLFNDQYGVLNWALSSAGLSQFDGYSWFLQWHTAFLVIGVVVVWQSFPFVSIALLAGLQTIPSEVMDAARVDGASAWQQVWRIKLPMLKPLLLVLVVISTIWDFKIFDQVYVLTGGGPARRTEVLAISTHREAFTQWEFGLGSALAVLLFVILVAITIFYIRLAREEQS